MLDQLNQHCENNHLLPEYQSAYRKGFSCETALIKLSNDILWNMEMQQLTQMCFLDLSAAFDTVDHEALLNVLECKFGICDTALNFFDNYLRPRQCKVVINGHFSEPQDLDFSVPQGSLAGPPMYNIYASTLKEEIPSSIDLHGYADDHGIKKSFPTKNIEQG